MRKPAAALVLVLVAALGLGVPSAAAAPAGPKVVIIVGATHGATAGYRTDADRAYAEAIKYTSNVKKVYSPYATWSKVKAAVAGASIVIYMGHGNGWPSPYTYDPNYTTKDGFGLNATYDDGDYNNKYYGEPYVAQLDLAPGAIILLHHLCYAAGNSEPGHAEPSVSVARQRADNYAAGFLKAGAAAVLADGHSGAENYLRALFTTHQSVEDMWRTMSNANGNVVSFGSSRTSGATVFQDPNTPTSGFYRSLAVRDLGLTTDEVLAGGYADTGVDPASLVVPGNAAVATEGASLYDDPDPSAPPAGTLSAGTRLRVVSQAVAATADSPALIEVEGIDDPSIGGYMAATDLAPRDSTPPVVRILDPGGPFSPNGDGSGDEATISGRFTEAVAWTLTVKNGGGQTKYQASGSGSTFETTWNGKSGGSPVADGTYIVDLTGVDSWQNPAVHATRDLVVDTVDPVLTSLTPGEDPTRWFSPNGDGVADTVSLSARNSETGVIVVKVKNEANTVVNDWTIPNGSAATPVVWDGRLSSGSWAPDGTYRLRVAAQDAAGNRSAYGERTITVIRALKSVASSKSIFFPSDLDDLSKATKLSFTLLRPMTVSWIVRDAAGQTVVSRLDAAAQASGTTTWTFNGRDAGGAMLPRGRYTSVVTATDGTVTATQSTAFDLDAFRVKSSDTTPKRGQKVTVSVTSAEALASRPKLVVAQPGLSPWRVTMVKTGSDTYKVTFRLKSGGSTGPVSFRVKGRDVDGGRQSTLVSYPLH